MRNEARYTSKSVWVLFIVGLCAAVGLYGLSQYQSEQYRRPVRYNGDTLGPENTESFDQYQQRSALSISGDASASSELRWGIIYSKQPLSKEDFTSEIINKVRQSAASSPARISTVITQEGQVIPLPEPSPYADQIKLIELAQQRAGVQSSAPLVGVVLHAPLSVFKDIHNTELRKKNSSFSTVEILGPGAEYGYFGMKIPPPITQFLSL